MSTEPRYTVHESVSAEQFVDLLGRSTLAERRPVSRPEVIAGMLEHADVLATAWIANKLVGVARSVTDFTYCCYLSDLAVDEVHQRQGIGKGLIRETRLALQPSCQLILLAAPAARGYYPRIGFQQHPSAWTMDGDLPAPDR